MIKFGRRPSDHLRGRKRFGYYFFEILPLSVHSSAFHLNAPQTLLTVPRAIQLLRRTLQSSPEAHSNLHSSRAREPPHNAHAGLRAGRVPQVQGAAGAAGARPGWRRRQQLLRLPAAAAAAAHPARAAVAHIAAASRQGRERHASNGERGGAGEGGGGHERAGAIGAPPFCWRRRRRGLES